MPKVSIHVVGSKRPKARRPKASWLHSKAGDYLRLIGACTEYEHVIGKVGTVLNNASKNVFLIDFGTEQIAFAKKKQGICRCRLRPVTHKNEIAAAKLLQDI